MRDEHRRIVTSQQHPKGQWRSFADLWGAEEINEERDRPMFKIGAPGQFEDTQNATLLTKERANGWVHCSYCKKRRCLYKRGKLSKEDKERVERVKESLLYTCGSAFYTEEDPRIGQELVVVRRAIQCTDPMETQYYKDLPHHDPVCCWCGQPGEDLEVDEVLATQYKCVLPVCKQCKLEKKEPVHARFQLQCQCEIL